MEKRECDFGGCEKPSRTRGLCSGHYEHWKKGQELRPLARSTRGLPVMERFMMKVRKGDSCWEWTGCTATGGYGKFVWSGKQGMGAHRASYLLFKGEIPEDKTVDHICQNVICVNPDHLRLATWTQNAQYKRRYKSTSYSGVRNVYRSPNGDGKYLVMVGKDGRKHYGGYFRDINEADKAAGELRARLFDFKEKPIE